MDFESKAQYIQRAVSAKHSFSATTQQTIYTAPSGDFDFDFAVIEGIFACDHGNQQTNLDISVTDSPALIEFFIFKQHNISAHGTEELVVNAGLILTQGEIVKAQVNHANIDLVISIIEYAKGD